MSFSAPTLIRLLTRVTNAEASAPARSLSDSLSQWLGWTDAIALSGALKSSPGAAPAEPLRSGADESALLDREQREFDRVRASLVTGIKGQGAPLANARRASRADLAPRPRTLDVDFAIHRQRYVALQHTMELALAHLRVRLRTTLAALTPDMNRLAVMDAVMEQVLDARQRSLLAGVPALLGTHFQRLQAGEEAAIAAHDPASTVPPIVPGTWLNTFREDMQSVLLAELDIRLHPAQGLMAALRAC